MQLDLDAAVIDGIDLSRFLPFVPPDYQEFFQKPAGQEHYRLLGHLSTLFNDITIVDVGTDAGCSAMALSHNPANRVVSYDIVNNRRTEIDLPNVEFRIKDALSDDDLLMAAPLILLDTAHEGPYEHIFYQSLAVSGYHGLLVLDDVYLNAEMRAFWDSIAHTKYDISAVGHWSGTGLVVFE